MSSDPIISKETFLKSYLPEGTTDVLGIGVIRIRGLSRAEVLKASDMSREDREVAFLVAGIVEPELSEPDVRAWRESTTTRTVNAVVEAILDLSGMLERSAAEAKRSFQGPGEEVRVPAGGEAGDDGGENAGGDAPG
jgi:hypothetical protein